ncbi:MAG: SocA family protein [Bacteroidales bacterium]|nr:SocA family protein [Bacteroidales bacterium]
MNVQFDKEKSLNALLYVANRVQRKDFHKIFKIIYFADRQHLADWGRPITGDTYIAMEAGPVPSRLYDMLKIVRGDSYLPDMEGLSKYFQVENWMYVRPLQDADLNKLSANEQEAMSKAIEKYAALSYDEIKEKSHDVAWRSTARDFLISWDNIAREAGLDEVEVACLRDYSTMHPLPECDMTPEELYDAIEKEIDYIYAQD